MSTHTPKPPLWTVVLCFSLAACGMAAGVYFGGHDQLSMAMIGTGMFVLLGGVGFELARRRSA